jgi:hypothetical protein
MRHDIVNDNNPFRGRYNDDPTIYPYDSDPDSLDSPDSLDVSLESLDVRFDANFDVNLDSIDSLNVRLESLETTISNLVAHGRR